MSNEKFLKLMQDEEFVKKIFKMQTPEEVQNELKNEGVELSVEEVELLGSIINKSIEKNGESLTGRELLEIAGGVGDRENDEWQSSEGEPENLFRDGLLEVLLGPLGNLIVGYGYESRNMIDKARGQVAGQGLIVGTSALIGAGVTWAVKDRQKIKNFFKKKFNHNK